MGSPILGYTIYILTSDGTTFGQDKTFCDGSQASIISALKCEVPIATLTGSVYNLSYGSSVSATVVAYNLYGNSLNSTLGSGAVLITYPSAPTTLVENRAAGGATQIGITWVEGASNGGTSVIDYSI